MVVNCEKLPWVPFRSGVHIAESSLPLNFCGGKEIGMRSTVEGMPFSPKMAQNGRLLRRNSRLGRDNGIRSFPIFKTRDAGPTRADESCGRYDLRSRSRKSKILCFAGLTPVANVDHATGDNEGNVVRSRL